MNPGLFAKVFSSVWAIERQTAFNYAAILLGKHEIKTDDFSKARDSHRAYFMQSGGNGSKSKTPTGGSVMVIPLKGPLMKDDQDGGMCGDTMIGMDSIAAAVRTARINPDVIGVIMHVDSPGGTVDGTENLANEIKACDKPIIALVDGMAASAAMWIASACDEIIINGETGEMGSIGVMCSFADMRPMLEKQGVVFHDIISELSPDKNRDFIEALKGDYKGIQEGTLKPLTKMFQDTVIKNRPLLNQGIDGILSGKMFFAADAIKYGLADRMGNMDDALQLIIDNGQLTIDNNKNLNSKNMKFSQRWAAIAAKLGWNPATAEAEGKELNAAMIDMLNADLAVSQGLKGELEAALVKVGTLEGSVATLTTEKEALVKKIEELGEQPGAMGTKTPPEAPTEGLQEEIPNAIHSWQKHYNRKVKQANALLKKG